MLNRRVEEKNNSLVGVFKNNVRWSKVKKWPTDLLCEHANVHSLELFSVFFHHRSFGFASTDKLSTSERAGEHTRLNSSIRRSTKHRHAPSRGGQTNDGSILIARRLHGSCGVRHSRLDRNCASGCRRCGSQLFRGCACSQLCCGRAGRGVTGGAACLFTSGYRDLFIGLRSSSRSGSLCGLCLRSGSSSGGSLLTSERGSLLLDGRCSLLTCGRLLTSVSGSSRGSGSLCGLCLRPGSTGGGSLLTSGRGSLGSSSSCYSRRGSLLSTGSGSLKSYSRRGR
ncbi:hypothetical protein GNI_183810 [Gregarina niphandrodes]|uniref:Uncharacterized protein n=1 Tax=Gregarina niphandrodes TaxID=110365 RepID=A0A023AY12_GRENI|nr:hypothetical protein GNI_183810 [Gregarina niphandrodes]EZG43180.1 hypothetical protein GNI_183810 [Gregarina niphandrodes]|eukprot:XP_011133562.1 hypothetical protein GNI_183810 [Gregarina niphandrodes]